MYLIPSSGSLWRCFLSGSYSGAGPRRSSRSSAHKETPRWSHQSREVWWLSSCCRKPGAWQALTMGFSIIQSGRLYSSYKKKKNPKTRCWPAESLICKSFISLESKFPQRPHTRFCKRSEPNQLDVWLPCSSSFPEVLVMGNKVKPT